MLFNLLQFDIRLQKRHKIGENLGRQGFHRIGHWIDGTYDIICSLAGIRSCRAGSTLAKCGLARKNESISWIFRHFYITPLVYTFKFVSIAFFFFFVENKNTCQPCLSLEHSERIFERFLHFFEIFNVFRVYLGLQPTPRTWAGNKDLKTPSWSLSSLKAFKLVKCFCF